MRFLAALLIAALILGSVGISQHMLTRRVHFDVTRDADGHGNAPAESDSTWRYRLEFTPTFDAAVDPFAVRLDAADESPRLLVRYAGEALVRLERDWRRGEVEALDSVAFSGTDAELLVQASPSEAESVRSCGLRVRVLREDGVLCDDQTLWTEGGGAALVHTVSINLEPILEQLDRGLGEGAP